MTSARDEAAPASSSAGLEASLARRRVAAARVRRRRRLALIALPFLGLALWAIVSYTSFMLAPTSMTFTQRSVEWVRQDAPFGNWIVDNVEHVYYSVNAPSKGGPQLKALPTVGLSTLPGVHAPRAAATALPAQAPPPIKTVFAQRLPGEGVYRPTGPPVQGGPPVLVTTFRPELDYPRIVAYVAWFDHTRTDIGYYPGRYEPPSAAVRGPMMVPYDQRWRLRATFNGGFTYEDGHNGSADNGRVNEPLLAGKATLVGYRDGRIAIVKWGQGKPGPDVAWARQSLAPILWDGRLNPELDENPNSQQWGFTLGGVTRVWRTAVGVDRNGNLIYVAADNQTVITIAKILQRVGAVRGMEFDINPDWHTLITYTHDHGFVPKFVEPQPNQPSSRYLSPDDRDFFAVYARRPGPVSVPFG